ncbi:MAG: 2-C-methyl-D-erythritol 4-phosphate cytidylyltransferase [Bdellovibrionales bacterium]|nr:2-C-methyl-D-erythritol 4-phosphate cytidylyltransferase [Bdellovibrionales bacterium]
MEDKGKRTVGILLAAGTSSRMGPGESKVLRVISGSSVLQRSIDSLSRSKFLKELLIAVPSENISAWPGKFHSDLPCKFIVGGASRSQSVRCGLSELSKDPPDYVLIHDAARCLVTPEIIDRSIEAAFVYQAATVGVECVDSIKEVDVEGRVLKSLNRDRLWSIQTPQVFSYQLLRAAHQGTSIESTDDASLVERIHPVHVVRGDRSNIKITTQLDIAFAEAALSFQSK